MAKGCNAIIRENKKLIENFEENFNNQILHYQKEFEKHIQEYKEDYVFQYVNHIYPLLYQQINETLIILDINRCTIIERPTLIEQLKELYRLFFEFLEKSEYKSDYWKFSESQQQDFFDNEYLFINPNDFKEYYILELIYSISKDYKNIASTKKAKDNLDFTKETWFIVGLEFANGNIYNNYDKKSKITRKDFTKSIFKERYIEVYEYYIYGTLKNYSNKEKNIFKRTNATSELKYIMEYCKENNIKICNKFIEVYDSLLP